MKLVDQLARVDEKLDAWCDQYRIDVKEFHDLCNQIQAKVDDLEKRRSELVKEVEETKTRAAEMKAEFDKWKLIWGAIAIVVTPAITTLVLFVLDHFLNGLPW